MSSSDVRTNVIGGERVPAHAGRTFESLNPADPSQVIGRYARSGPEDAQAASRAARAAQPGWAAVPAPQRALVLERAAEILNRRADEIAAAISREMGKPIGEALGYEVRGTIKLAKYLAGEGRRMFGYTAPSELQNKFGCVMRAPIGVTSLITPWNLPLLTPAGKVFGSLICGNAAVFKPSEETPHIGHLLVEVLEEAGLPPGVLNLVTGHGAEIGEVLATDPEIDLLSFTGSTQTGRLLGGQAGGAGKKLSLEMGGKNAIIVMDDAELDVAVEGAIWGGYGTSGQRCTASSRLIVHRSVHRRFVEAFAARVEALKVGDPLDPAVQLGPLVSRRQLDKVHAYTGIGLEEGAKLVTGGHKIDLGGGHYYAPTLFDAVTPRMRIAQEEIFGPTVCVLAVDSLAEAIATANGTPFGLSLAIYTQNINNAFVAMRDLKSGLVYVNSPTIGSEIHYPFGGVKATGNGQRENGQSSIEEYSELKTLFVDYSGAMRRNGM